MSASCEVLESEDDSRALKRQSLPGVLSQNFKFHPDDQISSKYVTPGFKSFSVVFHFLFLFEW